MPTFHVRIVRDIAYFYHECADVRTIFGDNDYWALLKAPYYNAFFNEDEFVQHGALLIFIGMLIDWIEGSGFPFGKPSFGKPGFGKPARHSFPIYLDRLLTARETVALGDPTTKRLCDVAISLCAYLDHLDGLAAKVPDLKPELLLRFRSVARPADFMLTREQVRDLRDETYDAFVRPYFVERST